MLDGAQYLRKTKENSGFGIVNPGSNSTKPVYGLCAGLSRHGVALLGDSRLYLLWRLVPGFGASVRPVRFITRHGFMCGQESLLHKRRLAVKHHPENMVFFRFRSG